MPMSRLTRSGFPLALLLSVAVVPSSLLLSPPHAVHAQDYRLQSGDRGPAVDSLQRALVRFRLLPQVTGVYGASTVEAVSTFQRIRELPVTGIADDATLRALGLDPEQLRPLRLSHPTLGTIYRDRLAPGDRGDDVTRLQRALQANRLRLGVDGIYGSETQQAVTTYQAIRGLPATGIADRATLQALGFGQGAGASAVDDQQGNYFTVVVGSNDRLAVLRFDFAQARLFTTRQNDDVIVLGQHRDEGVAYRQRDTASTRGWDARVMHRRQL